MRKPTICIGANKDAGNREADQSFVFATLICLIGCTARFVSDLSWFSHEAAHKYQVASSVEHPSALVCVCYVPCTISLWHY